MELKVRGWGRYSNRPARPLKEADLLNAKFNVGIGYEEVAIRLVPGRTFPGGYQLYPVRQVKVDFAINLSNFSGDYFTTLGVSRDDVALLYCLVFDEDTVENASSALEKARARLRELRSARKEAA